MKELAGFFDSILTERQIQPSQNQKENNILLIGGSPGTGKNWVVNNLTDIKNRYKVFDIDEVKELLASSRNGRLEVAFIDYVRNDLSIETALANSIIDDIKMDGFFSQLAKRNHSTDVIHQFITETKMFNKKVEKFFLSVSGNRKPNIAFNSTMRNLSYSKSFIDILLDLGYNPEVEVLWVVNDTEQMDRNIKDRDSVRKTDVEYVKQARKLVSDNLINVLSNKSIISRHVSKVHVVVNDPSTMTKYDNSNLVKDFKYYTVDPTEQKKARSVLTKISRDNYL